MPWSLPKPRDTWSEREKGNFSREIWSRIHFADVQWTPAAVPASTAMDTLFYDGSPDVSTKAAVGLRVSMEVHPTPPAALPAGVVAEAACLVNDQLTIRISNLSGVPVTPPAGLWAFCGTVI